MQVHRIVQRAIRIVYPPRCLGCGDMVQSDFGLCGTCWRQAWFIAAPRCDRCGAPLPGAQGMPDGLCDDCLQAQFPWRQGRAAVLYKDLGRTLVLGLKHGDRSDIVPFAATWMARAGGDVLRGDALIIPIPLHRLRLLRRRYNQAALLAQALGRATGLRVCVDALWRTKLSPMMEDAPVATRFATLSGAITINPRRAARLRGQRVVLVDDVMTTGATLSAATEACLSAGARDVCTITLARALKGA